MMKITKKRIISLLLASLMLMSVFGTLTANAANKGPKLASTSGTYYLKKSAKQKDIWVEVSPYSLVWDASQIKNLKSSNPRVATVSAKFYSEVYLIIKPIKTGTTTISCTVNGKNLKYKLTVCKYANPFKKLMLGDQNYASSFNQKETSKKIKNPGDQRTLNITLKKGWKLTKIVGTYWDPDADDGFGDYFDKNIKNGENLDLSKKWRWFKFTFKNKKGVKEDFTLYFK